jgi:hypothetical protein
MFDQLLDAESKTIRSRSSDMKKRRISLSSMDNVLFSRSEKPRSPLQHCGIALIKTVWLRQTFILGPHISPLPN